MHEIKYELDDIVEMKKPHPCGSNKWKIIRLGADIRIKCLKCNHSVLLPRIEFNKKIRKVVSKVENLKDREIKTFNNQHILEKKVDLSINFQAQTELFKLGYRITGLTRNIRWKILIEKAVPKLGLYSVVYTIASHIKNRKIQTNGEVKYKNAIKEWEHDLARLKKELYNGNFKWPDY